MKTITEFSRGIGRVEALVCEQPLVCACIAVGEDKPYYAVLLSPDKTALTEKLRGTSPNSNYNLATYQGLNQIDVRSFYCDLLEQVNKRLDGKRIERFALLDFDRIQSREAAIAENRSIIESFYQDYIAGVG